MPELLDGCLPIIRQTKCLRIFETKRPDEKTKRTFWGRFVLYINVVRIALEHGFLRLLLVMARRPFFLLAAAGCRGAARVLAPEDNSAVPPCAAVGCVRRRLCETSPAHSGQLQRLHLQLSGKQWLQSDRRSGVLRGFHRLLSHRGYCVRFPRLRVPARAVSRPPGRCSGGVSREHCRRALPQSARKIRVHSAGYGNRAESLRYLPVCCFLYESCDVQSPFMRSRPCGIDLNRLLSSRENGAIFVSVRISHKCL